MMHKNRSVDLHSFAMVPKADIPRSSFTMQKTLKTTFDSGFLVPVLCEEMLPGDTFNLRMTAFARLATPIFPVMDNLYLESFFFFVPNRLVWNNWVRFMGEQTNPSDSISFTVPQILSPVSGYAVGSLADYFGLPTVGQIGAGNQFAHSALPLRGYNLIYNQWFRDQNIQNSAPISVGDGPDPVTDYGLLRRGKRHDYFTSCLPFLQKGTAVLLPLGTTATVRTNATDLVTGVQPAMRIARADTGGGFIQGNLMAVGPVGGNTFGGNTTAAATAAQAGSYPTNLFADLTTATAATINQIRQAFQIQKLLERDARGGTRYTEVVRAHFGVASPDARLQRPEYLGGGMSPITISPIAQTSATGVTGGSAPLATLGAVGTSIANSHGCTYSSVEHGYIIGIVNVRADLTYQQGLRKHWSRSTRFDFYYPVFANLGEQAVLSREIFCDGSAGDNTTFGFQERWGEYRYLQSEITGRFRSTAAGTLDPWHLAQRFTVRPTLNAAFIQEDPPVGRIIAVPSQPQFLFDAFFSIKAARPMPMYSVPGLVDHF